MQSELLNYLGFDPAYIIIGLFLVNMVLLVICIVILVKFRKLKKIYENFMRGKNAESLEEVVLKRFEEIDQLKVKELEINTNLEKITETLKKTYQKMGIVKYDAFKEMGGKLSFSLAMLNQENSGFIINAMHSREGCYTYIKEIIHGESFIMLAEEEKEALEQALHADNPPEV